MQSGTLLAQLGKPLHQCCGAMCLIFIKLRYALGRFASPD